MNLRKRLKKLGRILISPIVFVGMLVEEMLKKFLRFALKFKIKALIAILIPIVVFVSLFNMSDANKNTAAVDNFLEETVSNSETSDFENEPVVYLQTVPDTVTIPTTENHKTATTTNCTTTTTEVTTVTTTTTTSTTTTTVATTTIVTTTTPTSIIVSTDIIEVPEVQIWDKEYIESLTMEERKTIASGWSEYELLARIINAEAGGAILCSDEDRLLTGQVVMNRINSSYFPDTMIDVVFQENQYAPTWDTRLFTIEITCESWEAANLLLAGNVYAPANVLFQTGANMDRPLYKSTESGLYFYTHGNGE